MRAKVSVVAPPGDGTMILIGLAGYVCAWLQTGMPNAIAAVIKRRTIVVTGALPVIVRSVGLVLTIQQAPMLSSAEELSTLRERWRTPNRTEPHRGMCRHHRVRATRSPAARHKARGATGTAAVRRTRLHQ